MGQQVSLQFRVYAFFGREAQVDDYHNSIKIYIFPECSSSTQQNWGNQEVEPVGPQVVQQGAPYRQWLPRKTVKRAGRRLISKLCQSDERYLLTLQLLILIAGKGKLQLGESEVRKKLI